MSATNANAFSRLVRKGRMVQTFLPARCVWGSSSTSETSDSGRISLSANSVRLSLAISQCVKDLRRAHASPKSPAMLVVEKWRSNDLHVIVPALESVKFVRLTTDYGNRKSPFINSTDLSTAKVWISSVVQTKFRNKKHHSPSVRRRS